MRASPLRRNISSVLRERVRRPAFLEKLAEPSDLAPLFKNDDYIGWSGFTGVGYPKRVPAAIADHVETNNLQSKLRFNLFVGASVGTEVEDRWAQLDMIARRYPHQVGKEIAKGINAGRIEFADKHLSMFPQDLTYGYYSLKKTHGDPKKPLNWAIVEATAITEDGHIVPGASVGATPEILESAEKIIIEVNTHLPNLEASHAWPPRHFPFIHSAAPPTLSYKPPGGQNRKTSIAIDPDRVVAIVESHLPDNTGGNAPESDESIAIAGHLIDFLSAEVDAGRLPKSLLPLQSGIGNVANSIIGGLAAGPFDKVMVWTEVLQDTFIQFFDSGKLDFATATSIKFSPEGFDHFYAHWAEYKDRLMLRSQQVANAPEIIRRLGVIAMNTPLEVDIYAHANSTCALGSRMLNGLGGSADFLRNAKLSIMHTPSSRPTKNDPTGISCIVPFASHVDQTEHDLDVIVTEQGLADLRGLSPRERAPIIIKKCAHPDYRDLLLDYYERSLFECLAAGRGHEPHMLRNAFKFHTNFLEHGTMKGCAKESMLVNGSRVEDKIQVGAPVVLVPRRRLQRAEEGLELSFPGCDLGVAVSDEVLALVGEVRFGIGAVVRAASEGCGLSEEPGVLVDAPQEANDLVDAALDDALRDGETGSGTRTCDGRGRVLMVNHWGRRLTGWSVGPDKDISGGPVCAASLGRRACVRSAGRMTTRGKWRRLRGQDVPNTSVATVEQ
ncbi:hypothetical protein DFH09DRAFT_1285948 [Mycena vulgaris]|nr:hypothetical protein DFH09DRAFT_1285948 [Mycena vulgaris]